jgi:outer membrane protein assembly factor BamB
VTASPSIVTLRIPGEGPTPVAFVPSWDHNMYAIRVRNGSELWRFAMPDQPGAPYPDARSADVRRVDGLVRVFVAGGETLYCLAKQSSPSTSRRSASLAPGLSSRNVENGSAKRGEGRRAGRSWFDSQTAYPYNQFSFVSVIGGF